MTRTRIVALVLAVVLVTTPVAGQGATVTIDEGNALASDKAVTTYETKGVVTRDLKRIDASVTIAESHDDVGVIGPHMDINNVWLRVDYDEELSRTVRIYIPSDYFTPRVDEGLESVDGGTNADLSPVEGTDEWTMLTLRVDGPTEATFAVSKEAGAVWDARRFVRRAVNNTTGVTLPTLGSTNDWSYISPRRLAGNDTVSIPHNGSEDITLQYDADSGADQTWLAVPDCDDPSSQRVCHYEKGNETVVLATDDDPPQVRYKAGSDPSSDLVTGWNDLKRIPTRINEWVGNILG